MGLDIGYTLYEKKPFDEEGKLVPVKDDSYDRWACGRCEVNNSWGDLFVFKNELTVVPVFQKELEGKVQKIEEYSEEYKLYTFDEFKKHILEAIKQVYEDSGQAKLDIWKAIRKRKEEINELRELQKNCNSDQEYAFNRWAEEIDDLKETNIEAEEYYDNYDKEDYDYSHAKRLEQLIRTMEEDLKEDKYYIIPYYSF